VTLPALKQELIAKYHAHLEPRMTAIQTSGASHQAQAKEVNVLISAYKELLRSSLQTSGTPQQKQQALLVLQYCTSVVSLEYRHKVWPYEYMALSRRVGELWERFCSAAWDNPSRAAVHRIPAPSFDDVATEIRSKLSKHVTDPDARRALEKEIGVLFELVGEINMKEDEVFTVERVPHVIDFKSGFGSNEKGNTLRLQTVGRAYKLWNPDTKLLFLVRQQENNNYLNVIRRSGLWDVRCGADAYAAIDELTGSNICELRGSVFDFERDLSNAFWSDLRSHLSDLTRYLQW
jgi:hypothetical protein